MSFRVCAWVVTCNRAEQLRRCVESLVRACEPVEARLSLEIRVLLDLGSGDSDSESALVLDGLRSPRLKWTRTEKKLGPAEARNVLLKSEPALQYDWAFFIDDDAYVETDYFQKLLKLFERAPGAAVIGGPNLTPPGSSVFQIATGEVLSYRFGNYLSTARYRRKGDFRPSGEEELILCNLLVRRDWAERFPFPKNYVCAEENRLLQELKKSGAEIYHEPSLHVFHERRESLGSLASQVYKYGAGRGQNLRDVPGVMRVAHVLPSILLMMLVVLLVCACFGDPASLAALILGVVTYLLACVFSSLWISVRARVPEGARATSRSALFFKCVEIFPTLHFSYAVGVIRGLLL